ncbi:MAG TPA: Lrp/AsnC family transcriptional regulator [Candidatus Thermoplasmatota archaeon]|nr:Lrp/AsnC family transcriptional regulator [Candidatus Thermoplasmatota archaeon]
MARRTHVPKPRTSPPDLLLLQALLLDGRASHRELASRTGLGLATVNRHVRAMEQAGTIRGYTVRVAPEAVGWTLTAIVGLRIDKGHVRTVQQEIAADPRIFAVYDVTGEWDGIVLARLRDREDLDDLVKTTLSATHIQRTSTMFVLKTVLEEAVVNLPGSPARKGPSAHPL